MRARKNLRPNIAIVGDYVIRFRRPTRHSVAWCVHRGARIVSVHSSRHEALVAALAYHKDDRR
jgi:hypothetical protein